MRQHLRIWFHLAGVAALTGCALPPKIPVNYAEFYERLRCEMSTQEVESVGSEYGARYRVCAAEFVMDTADGAAFGCLFQNEDQVILVGFDEKRRATLAKLGKETRPGEMAFQKTEALCTR